MTGSTDRTQGDHMKEAEAHEFYKDPDHLAVTGQGEPPRSP